MGTEACRPIKLIEKDIGAAPAMLLDKTITMQEIARYLPPARTQA